MKKFCIIILVVNFGKSVLYNSNWDKTSECIIKSLYEEQRETSFKR